MRPDVRANDEDRSSMEWMAFERQAALCRAFGNPVRLKIIELLTGGERRFSELQNSLGVSKPNLSHQLSVLKAAGIVRVRRQGKEALCMITVPEVKRACRIIRGVIKGQLREANRVA